MNQVTLTTIDGLDPRDMLAIRSRLTHAESEFQTEVNEVLEGTGSSCTPIAVCHIDGALVGWACSHIWREMQTLEQFVDERHRRKCIGLTLSAALVTHQVIDRNKPLTVFSEATAAIARKLWHADVVIYKHDGDDWVLV